MDDSGFPRTPDRLLEPFGTRARRSEIFETMMDACGPLNSRSSPQLLPKCPVGANLVTNDSSVRGADPKTIEIADN